MFKPTILYSILIIAILALTVQKVNAQQGIGTDLPSKAAALEIKSGNKGILIPRIALTDTHTFDGIISGVLSADNDFETKTNSLLVYNTAEQNDVSPGFYYWTTNDTEPTGGKWKRLVNLDDLGPWYSQDTGLPTTDNTDNIYQTGHVAIGKDSDFIEVPLDVFGSIRGGDITGSAAWPVNIGKNSIAVGKDAMALGENSVAMGNEVIASGKYSQAYGNKSRAIAFGSFAGGGYQETETSTELMGGMAKGKNSFAFGNEASASGDHSVAFGYKANAEGISSVVYGFYGSSLGKYSFSMGEYVTSSASHNAVFGRYNAIVNGDKQEWLSTDPIFEVGIGSGYYGSNPKNALTILKNGRVGIGISGQNDTAKPTQMLDVGAYIGSDSSKRNRVRVRDLPITSGSSSDRIVTVRNSGADKGVLRSVTMSNMRSYLGVGRPWKIQGSDNWASENNQNIYQEGNIAIGKTDDFFDSALDVKGSIRAGEISKTTETEVIGSNSFAMGKNITLANKANSFAFGNGAKATGVRSFAFGLNTEAESDDSFAFGEGSKANGVKTFSFGLNSETGANYSFAFGKTAKAESSHSFAFGDNVTATNDYEVVFGRHNETITDGIFQIAYGTSGTPKNILTVLKDGWVGIGHSVPSTPNSAYEITGTEPGHTSVAVSEKLRVNGTITTTGISFPDYVFQTYYDGTSDLKPDYSFKDLKYIKSFLKENKHLPGILPASALQRNEKGHYEFNLSGLTVQNLEKIEELYLHTIEQEEKIETQEEKIELLENEVAHLKERLHKLEKILNLEK